MGRLEKERDVLVLNNLSKISGVDEIGESNLFKSSISSVQSRISRRELVKICLELFQDRSSLVRVELEAKAVANCLTPLSVIILELRLSVRRLELIARVVANSPAPSSAI